MDFITCTCVCEPYVPCTCETCIYCVLNCVQLLPHKKCIEVNRIELTDYTRIKNLIAPYVMRSRAHAIHRGLIAWWEGDTKREKEDEWLKIASRTVLLNDRVRSRLLGKHKFDAKELFPT